jgi:hypothetical protein
MLVLYTDFGAADIYVGQLKAAILAEAGPAVPVIDLFHDLPAFDIPAAAHLLAALQHRFARGTVFLAVVDPGVGSARDAAVLEADGRWFVGPDNGLLSVVAGRAAASRSFRIVWRPAALSASFHGRDLFAPIAARIAADRFPAERLQATATLAVRLGGGDLPQVIHIDRYGNCVTGLRAGTLARDNVLVVAGQRLAYARVFAETHPGQPFWYENSIGLIEIAANRASAAALLEIEVGTGVAPAGRAAAPAG